MEYACGMVVVVAVWWGFLSTYKLIDQISRALEAEGVEGIEGDDNY